MIRPGIKEKVAFLSRPEIYRARRVEVKETHMSWVFLTEDFVWKLKKPVRSEYFDFSTPEARWKNCQEEVRLNRRLARNVYLGVVPLTISAAGELQLAGVGEAIDSLVKMRRLPGERMLDLLIAGESVSQAELRKVGALLAGFYQQAPPAELTPAQYRQRLSDEVRANRQELSSPEYALPLDLVISITSDQLSFLDEEKTLFDERVRAGKIVEAHGDLRPEHICLETEPVIIDCLEFNRELRMLDSVSELSFLALECERLGAPRAGALILQISCAASGDLPPERLIAFYRRHHACLRAKIALWHLKDDGVLDAAKWTGKAEDYLRLARRAAAA